MELKYILNESGLSTTAHAIPKIIRAKQNWLKLFWTILLISSATGCFILLVNDIKNFFDREVVTQITVNNEISSEFPSVKICNKNYNYYDKEFENSSLNNSSSYENSFYESTFKLSIISCGFNSRNCSPEDFLINDDISFGKCLSFNIRKNQTGHPIVPKMISRVGKNVGLRLEVKFRKSKLVDELGLSSGLMILIFNSSMNYSIDRIFEGIDVSTGLETNIIVNRLLINKKEDPYSKCIGDITNNYSNIVKFILNNGYAYRQKDCFDICINDLLLEKLGCYIPEYPYTKIDLNFTALRIIPCLEKNSSISDIVMSENTLKVCESKCPLECNSIQYNPVFYHGMLDQITKNNSLVLNIFYDSLSYTRIDEIQKTRPIDLISNIGGTLGLFLGISVLSIGEIFEIIFLVISSVFKQKSNTQTIEDNQFEQNYQDVSY